MIKMMSDASMVEGNKRGDVDGARIGTPIARWVTDRATGCWMFDPAGTAGRDSCGRHSIPDPGSRDY